MSEINPFDPEYVQAQIVLAYAKREEYRNWMPNFNWHTRPEAADGPNGEIYWSGYPTPEALDFWMVQIVGRIGSWGQLWTDEQLRERNATPGPDFYGWDEHGDWFWERHILYPWLWVDDPSAQPFPVPNDTNYPVPNTDIIPPQEAVALSAKAARGITPQLGLQEDDILYNLTLLAVNILQPLITKYPNVVVISGFRQVNSGMSQHERGEAADIQIKNQSDSQLYEVADWISKNLNFDQLVLNFSENPRTSWIHVSFSAQSLRYQVLTRDFDDTFHDGLYLIAPLTGEALATAQRESAATLTRIQGELAILEARDKKTNPTTVIGDELITETTGDVTADDGPGGAVPDHSSYVVAFFNANRESYDLSTDEGCGLFIEGVVAVLQGVDSQWGHLRKYGSQTQFNGHAVDAIAYRGLPGDPDGIQENGKTVTAVDIIRGAGADGAGTAWQVDVPRYEAKDWF